jgi:hypothetical protein
LRPWVFKIEIDTLLAFGSQQSLMDIDPRGRIVLQNFAPSKFALVKLAPNKSALNSIAPLRSAPLKFDLLRLAWCKIAPFRLTS